ncbi:MAG TPA: hypothetical protein VNZ45_00190 [Bacteroidia bacterium]|jgi:hypothetical protein|nr:hypothetical protein [Bacteroidia bacterium]
MKNSTIILFAFVLLAWTACKQKQDQGQTTNNNTLSDSLFKLHNIKSSLFSVDSSVINSFTVMDTIQKALLLKPEVIIDRPDLMKVGQSYINDFMPARFVAKQDKVGDLQPIIVSAHGDDYAALILLVLDKNNKVTSHLILSGGLNGGPDNEIPDSLIFYHDMQSTLQNDVIKTYILKVQQSEKDSTSLPIIDSISYTRKILPTGEIKLLKKDSSRYSRKVDSNWPKVSW